MTVTLRDVCRYSERLCWRFFVADLVACIAALWVGGALVSFLSILIAMLTGACVAAGLVRLHYNY